jgi:hypothetical protein
VNGYAEYGMDVWVELPDPAPEERARQIVREHFSPSAGFDHDTLTLLPRIADRSKPHNRTGLISYRAEITRRTLAE